MREYSIYISVVLLWSILTPVPAYSQKGVGENIGVVQQGSDLPITNVRGELLEIKTGPCEKSTGKSPYGTHLIVKSQGGNLNIHLGPTMAVDHVVNQLELGSTLNLQVFRTDRLPEDMYIAISVMLGEKTIHLRDKNLRPSWAYRHDMHGNQHQKISKKHSKRGPCW